MANLNKLPKDENGRQHGEWLWYHDNGKIMYLYNYVHGKYHGLCEGYKGDGKLNYRGYYNMGRAIGHFYYSYKQNEYYLWLI